VDRLRDFDSSILIFLPEPDDEINATTHGT
jgi:hypothetical protein